MTHHFVWPRRAALLAVALVTTAGMAACGTAETPPAGTSSTATSSTSSTGAAGGAGAFLTVPDLPAVEGATWQEAEEVPPPEGCFEPFSQRDGYRPKLWTAGDASVRQISGVEGNGDLASAAVREGTSRIEDCLSPDTLRDNGTRLVGEVESAAVSGVDEGKVWHFETTCAGESCGVGASRATHVIARVGPAVTHVVLGAAPDQLSPEKRAQLIERTVERLRSGS